MAHACKNDHTILQAYACCCGRADRGPKKGAYLSHDTGAARAKKRFMGHSIISTTFALWIGEVRKASSRQVICIGYSWLVHWHGKCQG